MQNTPLRTRQLLMAFILMMATSLWIVAPVVHHHHYQTEQQKGKDGTQHNTHSTTCSLCVLLSTPFVAAMTLSVAALIPLLLSNNKEEQPQRVVLRSVRWQSLRAPPVR